MIYNKLVTECFFHPQHVGILDCSQPFSMYFKIGEITTGNAIEYYLLFNEEHVILKARFKAYGNPYLIAGAEWICQQLQGSDIAEHPRFNYAGLIEKLAVPKEHYPIAIFLEKSYLSIVNQMKSQEK